MHLIAREKKIDAHIPIEHPVIAWLVEFVGDVLTKYLVGLDGKTAYERLFGKKSREEHLEFGEVVLWRKPRVQETNVVAEARWASGVWLGRRWGTPNHLVSYGNRVVECRAIQRVPKQDRWRRDMVSAVRATRWENPAVTEGAAVPAVLPGPAEPPPAPPEREYVPHRVYIRMEDLTRFGRTDGCRRCTLMTNGDPARGVAHTRACRERLEQAMTDAGDPRVQAAADRQNRHLADAVELAQQPVQAPAAQPAEEEGAPAADRGRRAAAAGRAAAYAAARGRVAEYAPEAVVPGLACGSGAAADAAVAAVPGPARDGLAHRSSAHDVGPEDL